MRILFLNHNVAGSGTYQRASHLAAGVAANGHEVTLITTRRTGRLWGSSRWENGLRIIEAPDLLSGRARNGWDAWNMVWRVGRTSAERYDLVHAFDCRPVVIAPALVQRRISGAALVLDWADWWGDGGAIAERPGKVSRAALGGLESWLEEAFRPGATANTVISEELRERCVGLGVARERVLMFPNGCAPPRRNGPHGVCARTRLGLPSEGPLLLHLGAAYPRDAELMFGMLRLVLSQAPSTRLALVGNLGVPVPADLVRSGAVIEAGFVGSDRLELWLAAADAGLIPLRDNIANRARWPGKINEYFTAGLPVVMPRVGAAAQWLARGGAGRVCSDDAPAFATAVVEVLTSDEAVRAQMRDAAHELAGGVLAWSGIVSRLLDFYEQWHGAADATVPLASIEGAT